MSIRIFMVLFLLLTALDISAEIYRCEVVQGQWLFTDRPCARGKGGEVELSPMVTMSRITSGGLSEAENKALEELEKRIVNSRQLRHKRQSRLATQARNINKIKHRNCVQTKQKLSRLWDKKAHGYKLSEAHALEQQMKRLQIQKKENCK